MSPDILDGFAIFPIKGF